MTAKKKSSYKSTRKDNGRSQEKKGAYEPKKPSKPPKITPPKKDTSSSEQE